MKKEDDRGEVEFRAFRVLLTKTQYDYVMGVIKDLADKEQIAISTALEWIIADWKAGK